MLESTSCESIDGASGHAVTLGGSTGAGRFLHCSGATSTSPKSVI